MKNLFLFSVIFIGLNCFQVDTIVAQESWRKALSGYIHSTLLKEDGGYGWPDQPDSHLTPTFAVTGILYTIDELPKDKIRLATFIKNHHPQKGPSKKEAGPSSSQLRDLTYQQIQAVSWLGDDVSSFVEEVEAWKSQAGNIANYEIHNYAGLFQETMTPVCRNLLGLPLDNIKSDFLTYLTDCRRKNGSFNNAPHTFGGDGNILNTYWSLKALEVLKGVDDPLKDKTIQWLQSCQLDNGGFTHQPNPEIAPNDEVIYTWAAIKSLKLLATHPTNAKAAVGYLLSLRNVDGGFGNRPGLPSTPMATYYALDALKILDGFSSLDKAPMAKEPSIQPETDFSGYEVYTVQLQAHGSGSPYEAVMLAKELKIHLWGVKNADEGWIEEAQRIAEQERVPVTFFISSEPYSGNITVPGMGTFNHVLDYIVPAGKDVTFEKDISIQDFTKTTLAQLKAANGGLIMQVSINEPLARLLLDEGIRTNGYLAISTVHFGQNFLFWLPYLYQYRYQLPFITLQDAHGPESWWWSNELVSHRTLIIAKEPTYESLVTALKNNWVTAVRHDSLTNYQTRMLGGTAEARNFILSNEESWKWWSGENDNRPWGIITVVDKENKFEEGHPESGVNIRIRSWWGSTRHILKHPITTLVQLKVNGSVVNPDWIEKVEKVGKRGEMLDSYHQYLIENPADGKYIIKAVFKNISTGETQTSSIIYQQN